MSTLCLLLLCSTLFAGENTKDEYNTTQRAILPIAGISEASLGLMLARNGIDTGLLRDLRKAVEKAQSELGAAQALMTEAEIQARMLAIHNARAAAPNGSEALIARLDNEVKALSKMKAVSASVKAAAIENAQLRISAARERMLYYAEHADPRFFRRAWGGVKIAGGALLIFDGGRHVWQWAATDPMPRLLPPSSQAARDAMNAQQQLVPHGAQRSPGNGTGNTH